MNYPKINLILTLLTFLLIVDYFALGLKSKKVKNNVVRLNDTRGSFLRLSDILSRDKKTYFNKKIKDNSDTEKLNEWIKEVDSTGLIRKIIKRKLYIPEDSSLSLTSQVSRPNILPNIFNQGEGFIVDAVIEWPIWLNLHKLSIAVNGGPPKVAEDGDPSLKSDINADSSSSSLFGEDEPESEGKSMSGGLGFIGIERCLIYDQIEMGMSVYLDISRNQSRDCVLRAVCEAQLVAENYPVAPTSIFFEVIHLILKPSLSLSRHAPCYENYLAAENAAYEAPLFCSSFVSKCPLNIAGLFVRNFFPEIL